MIQSRLSISPRIFSHFLIPAILLSGIALRLIYFFQNPNLIIDEANIARNLAERNFIQLLLPLSYEQYAPPGFLWIEKCVTIFLDFGEKALRLYPLLCGIGSLFVFYKIVSRLLLLNSFWYPLAILSIGTIYVKYSVEVKQYMPDLFIALLLIWICQLTDLYKIRERKFVLIWAIAGSFAIWSSMSSVFLLAGVGAFYLKKLFVHQDWKKAWVILVPGLIWIGQFLVYYFSILKPQIGSDYLQHYHDDYFLFALPLSAGQWMHNGKRLLSIIGEMGGFTAVALLFHSMLFITGLFEIQKEKKDLLWLLGIPILLMVVAAALRQYSLIERLVLFSLPLGLIVLGFGFHRWMRISSVYLTGILIAFSILCLFNYNMFGLFTRFYGFQEITAGMSYLKEHRIKGNDLFIHHSSGDSYLYYTTLHPDKTQWKELTGARILQWDDDYAQITRDQQDTVYFLFTGGFPEAERKLRLDQMELNMQQVDYFEKYICYLYGFAPKD